MYASAAWATILIAVVVATKEEKLTQQPEILFTGKVYLKYIPSKSIYEKVDSNKLVFRFRTVHPSGILFILTGKQRNQNGRDDNILSVQLIQGYFSYALSKVGRRSSEILINGNFNDDKWHDVMIIRTHAISEIRVDNHTKTLVSPPSYIASSFQDYVYIGGYDHSKLSPVVNNLLPLFIGCLQLIEVGNRDPIKYFQQGSRRIEVKPSGKKLLTGQCGQTKYNPIEFTKLFSNLIFEYPVNEIDIDNELIIFSFSIRTFSSSGLVFEAVKGKSEDYEIRTNEDMRAHIFDKVIHFKMWSFDTKWEVNIQSKTSIADGLWHHIEVKVSRNHIDFKVDYDVLQQTVAVPFSLRKLQKGLRFGGNEKGIKNPSKSFIGCLNHIRIQHLTYSDVINQDDVIKNNVKEGCTLLNHCFPDPCLNGGMCEQERNEGTCDCTGTEFFGRFCEKPLYKPSCSAYQKLGLNETSYCLIDSDGSGPLLPHTNLCEFDDNEKNVKEVATVVHHNKEYNFSPLNGDETLHSYTFHRFNYELDPKNMQSLIQYSRHCRQHVTFRCYNTALFNAPHGPSNVMWRTGSGRTKAYWGDVPTNSTGCECGVHKKCVVSTKKCNCDAMLKSWHEDTGYITEKSDLPVMRIQVTGMIRDRSMFTVGPLECFGVKNERRIVEDLKVYTDQKLLNKACVSVTTKENLMKIANITASSKLHKEKPLILTTPIYATHHPNGIVHSKTGVPLTMGNNEQPYSGLSTLEIVFIAIAALATTLLLVKFVFCTLFRKLHGQITLNHEQRFEDPGTFVAADTIAISSTVRKQNGNEAGPCNKGCVKVPSNYWV